MKERNKTEHVYDSIRRQIETGQLRPDTRVGSVRLLIQQFGVSQPVIMGALTRLESDGLVRREARRGVFVRDINENKSPLIGLYTFYSEGNVENYFESLNRVLLERNIVVLPYLTPGSTQSQLARTIDHGPDGFLVDARAESIDSIARKLGTRSICLVNILEQYPDIELPCSAVLSDRHHGMADAVTRLVKQGHQSIILAMANTPLPPENKYTRHSLDRLRITFPDIAFHEIGLGTIGAEADSLKALFAGQAPPTALLGSSDYTAFSVNEWIQSHLVGQAPLQVTGFYNTQWSRQPGREFDSYDMNYETIWSRAIDRLLSADSASTCIEWVKPSYIKRDPLGLGVLPE